MPCSNQEYVCTGSGYFSEITYPTASPGVWWQSVFIPLGKYCSPPHMFAYLSRQANVMLEYFSAFMASFFGPLWYLIEHTFWIVLWIEDLAFFFFHKSHSFKKWQHIFARRRKYASLLPFGYDKITCDMKGRRNRSFYFWKNFTIINN